MRKRLGAGVFNPSFGQAGKASADPGPISRRGYYEARSWKIEPQPPAPVVMGLVAGPAEPGPAPRASWRNRPPTANVREAVVNDLGHGQADRTRSRDLSIETE